MKTRDNNRCLSGFIPAFLLAALLAPATGLAWDARAFDGAGARLTLEDLYPREKVARETYYAEDYSFMFQLNKKVKLNFKFGMTNVLGEEGAAFVASSMRAPGIPFRKTKTTVRAGSWKFDDHPFSLKVGEMEFSGNEQQMTVSFTRKGVRTTAKLTAVVPGWRPGNGKVELANQGFIEVLIWPKLKVDGVMEVIKSGKKVKFKGYCVLTHAVTTIPPQFQPPRWFYFKGEDLSNPILFQAVQLGEEFGGQVYGWFLVVEKDKIVAQSNILDISPTDVREKEKISLPWSLYFNDPAQGIEGGIRAGLLKKAVDQLKKLPPFEAALIAKFIQPKMYVFDGELEIAVADGRRFRSSGMYKIETIRD